MNKYTEKQLWEMNKRTELLPIAKELEIVGRHELNKGELISQIMKVQKESGFDQDEDHDTKKKYVDSLEIGQFVAFRNKNGRMFSAKVSSILKCESNPNVETAIVVETKDGRKYTIKKQDIAWVRTGGRWPKGIYNALRGVVDGN